MGNWYRSAKTFKTLWLIVKGSVAKTIEEQTSDLN